VRLAANLAVFVRRDYQDAKPVAQRASGGRQFHQVHNGPHAGDSAAAFPANVLGENRLRASVDDRDSALDMHVVDRQSIDVPGFQEFQNSTFNVLVRHHSSPLSAICHSCLSSLRRKTGADATVVSSFRVALEDHRWQVTPAQIAVSRAQQKTAAGQLQPRCII
jgi:hypothetical protein